MPVKYYPEIKSLNNFFNLIYYANAVDQLRLPFPNSDDVAALARFLAIGIYPLELNR